MSARLVVLLLALSAAAGAETISEFDLCVAGDCAPLAAAGVATVASIDGASYRTRDGASVAALKRSAEGPPADGGGTDESELDASGKEPSGKTEVPEQGSGENQLDVPALTAEEASPTAAQPETETAAGDGSGTELPADGGGGITPPLSEGVTDAIGAIAEDQGGSGVTEPASTDPPRPGGDAGEGQDGDGGEAGELDWRTDYCTCDLTVSECDVDCCCDPDCDAQDRLAFSACQSRPSVTPDERYCLQSDLIFSNNTEVRLERVEGGLFCIVRDNLISRNSFTPVQPVSSSAEFERLVARPVRPCRYWWEVGPPPPPPPPKAERYLSGDRLWTVTEGRLQPWELRWRGPVSSGLCDAVRPVRFLRAAQTDCWLVAGPAGLAALNGRRLYQGLCVLAVPDSSKLQDLKSVECGRSPESAGDTTDRALASTLRVLPYLCSDVEGCTRVTEVPEPRLSGGRVLDALLSATVVVEQRAGRVSAVRVELVLGSAATGASVRQRREVSFRRPGGPPPVRRSGNPGYQRGLPLIAVKLVTNTSGETPRRVPSGSSRPIVLPSPGRGGGCGADARHWRPLVFGVDAVVNCRLEAAAGDCAVLQRRILTTLLAGLPANVSDTGVAAFGSAAISGDWLPVLGSAPTPSPETLPDGCRGLVAAARWRVAFAQAGAAWRPQARVTGVHLSFGRAGTVWADRAGGRLAVDLQSAVEFVDVTRRPVPRFAQPPRVDISLPSDFFYPFSAGGAGRAGPAAGLVAVLGLWVVGWMAG